MKSCTTKARTLMPGCSWLMMRHFPPAKQKCECGQIKIMLSYIFADTCVFGINVNIPHRSKVEMTPRKNLSGDDVAIPVPQTPIRCDFTPSVSKTWKNETIFLSTLIQSTISAWFPKSLKPFLKKSSLGVCSLDRSIMCSFVMLKAYATWWDSLWEHTVL